MKAHLEVANEDIHDLLEIEARLGDLGIHFDRGMTTPQLEHDAPTLVRDWMLDGPGSGYRVDDGSVILEANQAQLEEIEFELESVGIDIEASITPHGRRWEFIDGVRIER